jgi:hypothetical protein
MEEYKLNSGQKLMYSIILGFLIVGIIARLLDADITLYEKIFSIGGLSIIAIIIFLALTKTGIKIEGYDIIRRTITGEKRISISKIKSIKIKYFWLNMFSFYKAVKYYLRIELNDKEVINLFIYSYKDADRLLDLLEKKTNKKIEGRV